jgi:hypothetical protein
MEMKATIVVMNMLLTIAFMSLAQAREGGDGVGNGGGTVRCAVSAANTFNGDYLEDYVLQYNFDLPPAKIQSLDESLNRIQNGLLKIPWLYSDFENFRKDFLNQKDYSKESVWEPAEGGVLPIGDAEARAALLPSNCLDFTQAVIRVNPQTSGFDPSKRVFKYNERAIQRLQAVPLQLSFLVVHEWLWKFVENADSNRRINYQLHSKILEEWDSSQWEVFLKNAGINKPAKLDPFSPESCLNDPSQILSLKDREVFSKPQIYYRERSDESGSFIVEPYGSSLLWLGETFGRKSGDRFFVEAIASPEQYPLLKTPFKTEAFTCVFSNASCFSRQPWLQVFSVSVSVGEKCLAVRGRSPRQEFVILFERHTQ